MSCSPRVCSPSSGSIGSEYKPRTWLFPGHDRTQPIARKTVYLLCQEAGVKAQLGKAVYPHMLRHALRVTYWRPGWICAASNCSWAIRACAPPVAISM